MGQQPEQGRPDRPSQESAGQQPGVQGSGEEIQDSLQVADKRESGAAPLGSFSTEVLLSARNTSRGTRDARIRPFLCCTTPFGFVARGCAVVRAPVHVLSPRLARSGRASADPRSRHISGVRLRSCRSVSPHDHQGMAATSGEAPSSIPSTNVRRSLV